MKEIEQYVRDFRKCADTAWEIPIENIQEYDGLSIIKQFPLNRKFKLLYDDITIKMKGEFIYLIKR